MLYYANRILILYGFSVLSFYFISTENYYNKWRQYCRVVWTLDLEREDLKFYYYSSKLLFDHEKNFNGVTMEYTVSKHTHWSSMAGDGGADHHWWAL